MKHYFRNGLIGLVLVPLFAQAASETITIKEENVPYFKAIDEGFSSLMKVAAECRKTDAELYACLCDEATALEQLDSALRTALEHQPAWTGNVIHHDGVNYQIPSLEKQVEDVQKHCSA